MALYKNTSYVDISALLPVWIGPGQHLNNVYEKYYLYPFMRQPSLS